MYPHERSLVKRLESEPFALLGINSDRDREALKPILEKEKITWRSFWNGEQGTRGPISAAWKVRGWPTMYIVDAKGIIRFKSIGSPGGAVVDEWIDGLLKEMKEESAGTE